jgi:hypothetical protein
MEKGGDAKETVSGWQAPSNAFASEQGPPPRPRRQGCAAKLTLGLWFVAMVAISSSLLARHLVPLPRPERDPQLEASMQSLRKDDEANQWMAVHVLYTECRCSRLLADHLLHSRRPLGISEHVLLVGTDPALAAALQSANFRVHETSPTELAPQFHIKSVPLLLVVDPAGAVQYAGGYDDRKQGPAPKDLALIASAIAGRPTNPLPIFGCAVAKELQRAINPLQLP